MVPKWYGGPKGDSFRIFQFHVDAYSLAGEIPLDIQAHNLVACHIGLDLVVPLQDREKMVEVLDAHIFNAEIIDNEAKLNWVPFVFPKAWYGSSFVVALCFEMFTKEVVGQYTSLG